MTASRKLKIVLGPHGQVAALRSGEVRVEGVELEFVDFKRMPDAYRLMAREQPFDICELAPTTYLMAVAAGAPLRALALPMTRRFRHNGLMRRRDSTIRTPKDLEGRAAGVRAYSVTASVWTRGILAEDYGVDLDRVTWFTEDEEHVADYAPPPNVHHVAPGRTLASMMAARELEVAFAGLAGVGESLEAELVELVEDGAAREADWFRRTGIYPLHGVIALREPLLREMPELAANLYRAFEESKRLYWERVQDGSQAGAEDRRYLRLAELMGDPLPYGFAENKASFEALVRYSQKQRLVNEPLPATDSLFLDPR